MIFLSICPFPFGGGRRIANSRSLRPVIFYGSVFTIVRQIFQEIFEKSVKNIVFMSQTQIVT
jgi:hypothetical protein